MGTHREQMMKKEIGIQAKTKAGEKNAPDSYGKCFLQR